MEFLPNETHMLDLQLSMSDSNHRCLACVDARTNTWRLGPDNPDFGEWEREQYQNSLARTVDRLIRTEGYLPSYKPNSSLATAVYYFMGVHVGTTVIVRNFKRITRTKTKMASSDSMDVAAPDAFFRHHAPASTHGIVMPSQNMSKRSGS